MFKFEKGMKYLFYITIVVVIILTIIMVRKPENRLVELINQVEDNKVVLDYSQLGESIFVILKDKNTEGIYGDTFEVFTLNDKNGLGLDKIYEKDFSKVKPWKIKTAYVDGDGIYEIGIGVYKDTHYDSRLTNRLFVFNWDGEKLFKKWTGSKLGDELIDFEFMDLVERQGDELVIISRNVEGLEKIMIFYWFDFGFYLLAESNHYEKIDEIKFVKEKCLEISYWSNHLKNKVKLEIKNNNLIELRR